MKDILKAIGLGVLAGVIVGGYMSWKKSKEVEEKLNKTFDNEFMENLGKDLNKKFENINEELIEKSKASWKDFEDTKKETLNSIKERHAALDAEISKMEETTKDLEKVAEILQETKEGLETVAEIQESTKLSSRERHEKNMKTLEETEKQLDNLLDDLNK